jgi:KDO2-lipid IV(A) lauroyltransferase
MIFDWIGHLVNNPRRMQRLQTWSAWLPRRLVFGFVVLLGHVTFYFSPAARRQIMANMGELMPHIGIRERRSLCRKYIVHECLTIYEQAIELRQALRPSMGASACRLARFRFTGLEHLDEALKLGRGAIVYSPHIGNYFYLYWAMSQRYPCLSVVTAGSKELRNLFLGMYKTGVKAFDYDDIKPLDLIRHLRAHLQGNGVLFILGDFWRPDFPACTLFGKPSRTPAGTMTFSLLQKVPVIPFYGLREGWFDHHLVFEPPVYLYEKYSAHSAEQKSQAADELSRIMERLVSRKPEQWLYWFNVHERWEAEEPAASSAEGSG